jgi:hypothetical protein
MSRAKLTSVEANNLSFLRIKIEFPEIDTFFIEGTENPIAGYCGKADQLSVPYRQRI